GHDHPCLHPLPAGSAEAKSSCPRLSALTGGVCVASCKGPRGRRPGVKTVPDRGLTSARALQPPAQPRQKSLKASIVRGSLNKVGQRRLQLHHQKRAFFCSGLFSSIARGERGLRCGSKPRLGSVRREVITRLSRCVVTTPGRRLTPGGSGRLRDPRLA